ncbi:MAG: hypothetical protein ACK47F_00545 [Flavobacteriales bacterium]
MDHTQGKWGFENEEAQYPSMVFANNTEIITDFFYFEACCDWFDNDRWDVWRIDTETYHGDWYTDLNLGRYGKLGVYICTAQNIPLNALKLMRITDGICSFCGCLGYGMTTSRVLKPAPNGEVTQITSLLPCCYRDFADEDNDKMHHRIEAMVEQHGRYRLRY